MANQHFQQQQDHRYKQGEEQEHEEQQDRDHHNHSPGQSPAFHDLFAEVMDEQLLEMYDWETLSQGNQLEQGQLFELDSTTDMEQLVLVQDDVEQSPEIHTFESSEECEQQQKTQLAEECNRTPLSNIQTDSQLHSFDSLLFQIEQMGEKQQAMAPSSETCQQYEITTKRSS